MPLKTASGRARAQEPVSKREREVSQSLRNESAEVQEGNGAEEREKERVESLNGLFEGRKVNLRGQDCLDDAKLTPSEIVVEHSKCHGWREASEEGKDNASQRLRPVFRREGIGEIADIKRQSASDIIPHSAKELARENQLILICYCRTISIHISPVL